jgi:hypothetical protein
MQTRVALGEGGQTQVGTAQAKGGMMDIPMFLNGVVWEAVPPEKQNSQRLADSDGFHASLPHVTHEGVFEIMGHKMKCFRLSNGQAVFEKEDFERFCEVVLGIDGIDAAHDEGKK